MAKTKYFRSRLKSVLKEKRRSSLYHEEIAELTGLHRPMVTRWLSNRLFKRLDMEVLQAFADWLKVDPFDLVEVVEVDEADESSKEYAVA